MNSMPLRVLSMKRDDSSRRSKTEIATAATALASIGGLVGLAVSGVLMALPLWAAVLIVVAELLAPAIVFVVMKRGGGEG
jgi:uncharacterized membrane protein